MWGRESSAAIAGITALLSVIALRYIRRRTAIATKYAVRTGGIAADRSIGSVRKIASDTTCVTGRCSDQAGNPTSNASETEPRPCVRSVIIASGTVTDSCRDPAGNPM
jgi:hypothetical protein